MSQHADLSSNSESARKIIEFAFPRLRGMEVKFFDEGWDFRVFEIGEISEIGEVRGEWMFRFPKDARLAQLFFLQPRTYTAKELRLRVDHSIKQIEGLCLLLEVFDDSSA